jgi:hypothetical protein
MADSYIFASRNLFDARRDLFPTRPSLSAWLWAQSIIQSRAFVVTLSTNKMQHPFITLGMLESIPVLVPFIELANHAVGSRQVQPC